MTAMIVAFDILMDEVSISSSLQTKLVEELKRGRTGHQIHFEGSLCFISTPEDIYVLANRLVGASNLRVGKDSLTIIDSRSRILCFWGVRDMKICVQFQNYEFINISEKSTIDI
jgi:hypothetical protein